MLLDIGSPVFCVNASTPKQPVKAGYKKWIIDKAIYTVRDLVYDDDGKLIGVLLNEVNNDSCFIEQSCQLREPAFAIERFLPLPQDPIERNKLLLNLRPKLN